MTIGAGLISSFTPSTSTAKWVMFQFIAGFGRGCGLQMVCSSDICTTINLILIRIALQPLVAIQTVLPPKQTSIGIAIVLFFQTLGGTVFLSVGELIFSNSLTAGLNGFAPTVDITTVLTAGATAFRQAIPPEQVNGVIQAYSHAISHVFYLGTASAGMCFFICWGLGWHKVTKKAGPASKTAEA